MANPVSLPALSRAGGRCGERPGGRGDWYELGRSSDDAEEIAANVIGGAGNG